MLDWHTCQICYLLDIKLLLLLSDRLHTNPGLPICTRQNGICYSPSDENISCRADSFTLFHALFSHNNTLILAE